VLGYVWELPFAKNLRGPAATIAGGWSFEGIITFASGNPFDVLESFSCCPVSSTPARRSPSKIPACFLHQTVIDI
jgi:hypothetical protein